MISINRKPPYLESQTAGGFDITKDIEKILIKNPEILPVIQQALAARGLKIPVKVGKYANGVVSVPGPKGAGDVVPAMLSPGEAVIPAKMAKKYGGLINGMIAGNIPGYREGRYDRNTSEGAIQYMKSKLRGAPSAFANAGKDISYGSFSKEDQIVRAALEKQLKAENPNSSQIRIDKQIKSMLGMDLAHKRKSERTEKVGGKDITVKNWETKNIQKEHRSVNQYLQNLSDKAAPGQKGGTYLSSLKPADIAKASGVSPQVAGKELKSLIAGSHPSSRAGYQVLQAIAQQSGGARGTAVSELLKFRLNDKSSGSYMNALGAGQMNMKNDPAVDAKAREQQQARIAIAEKDLAKLKEQEVKDQKVVTKTTTSRSKSAKKDQILTPAQKAAETKKRNAEAKSQALANAQAKRDATNARRRELYAEKKAASAPAPKKPGIGSRIASGVRGMGGMGAGMGLSMAGMGISMIPGMQELGMAISIIGPMLMMLPLPITGVIAALGLLAFGAHSVIKAQEEQRKKAMELGDAQVMSQNSLEQMSEDLGTVSATEQRKAKQTEKFTSVTAEQISASQQYIAETESGQKLLADVKLQQEAGMSSQEIGTSVASNMATAVAQGVITKEQGQQIIAALGVMAGNLGISTAATQQFNTYTRYLTKTSGMTAQDNLANLSSDFEKAYYTNPETGAVTSLSGGDIGNLAITNAAATVNAYGQAVGGTDAINAAYDAKVKEAKTQKEINSLEEQRKVALDDQKQVTTDTYALIQKQRDGLKDTKFDKNFITSIEENFEEGSPMRETAKEINKLGDRDFKLRLQTQLQSGTLSPESIDVLLGYGAENKNFGANYDLAIAAKGEVDVLNAIEQLKASGNENQIDTFVNVASTSGASTESITESLEFSSANNLTTAPGSIGQMANALDVAKAKWDEFKDATSEKAKLEAIVDIVGDEDLAKSIKNSKIFKRLPAKQKKLYLAQMKVAATGTINKSSPAYKLYEQIAKDKGENPTPEGFVEWTFRNVKKTGGGRDGDGDDDDDGDKTGSSEVGGGEPEDKKLTALTNKLDKRQKAMAVISLRENAINKKYDERKKALEEIAKLNSQIAEQQRSQLDIADALSRGDIAAAARAVQAERARAAAFAQEQQMKALDEQRQSEIDNLSIGGKSRKSLEAMIDKLNMKIARREYKTAAGGGMIKGYSVGGKVMSYFAAGGKPLGSDTIPAMLTPGEFVVKRPAVKNFGVKNLEKINNGGNPSSGVYNYSISVNVSTDANPDQIARAVAQNVKRTESYRIRGNRL
jgi:hypothetical protein